MIDRYKIKFQRDYSNYSNFINGTLETIGILILMFNLYTTLFSGSPPPVTFINSFEKEENFPLWKLREENAFPIGVEWKLRVENTFPFRGRVEPKSRGHFPHWSRVET